MNENLLIKNWNLDYRKSPYGDCTDGDFLSDKQFTNGDFLTLNLNREPIILNVKVVASTPEGNGYRTYYDITR